VAQGRAGQGRTPQIFRLFGFAGTGKTTLARELAAKAGGTVLFATFTGKAASSCSRRAAGARARSTA
jgi:exodeoxyribonuclease-5